MTHYQTLGVTPQATAEEIRFAYERLLAARHKDDEVQAINEAYDELSNPFRRAHYDSYLYCKEFIRTMDRRRFPITRKFKLLRDPYSLNHYDYINQLFMTAQGDEDHLIPGQLISAWDKNRIHWQTYVVAGALHAESEQLKRIPEKTTRQKRRLDLLLKNERKMGLASTVLSGNNEKTLYDISLGSNVVQQTEDMQDIARLIGGWERMAELAKRHPQLGSANAILAMRQAGCLNPASFSLFMTCEKPLQFSNVGRVLTNLHIIHLLNLENFQQVMRHKENALSIGQGVIRLGFAGLLDQQTFEILLTIGKQAGSVGTAWRYLKEDNLLNTTNRERVLTLGREGKPIGTLCLNALRRLTNEAQFTPEDGLALQWTGETPELQALSLRIDEMFAYGLNLLGEDDDKALVVFLLALDLKKALQTHFNKPKDEQRRTANPFKAEFKQLLHSKDEVMAEHRAVWKVIVANVAIALTGLGLLALGAYFLYSGQCFFATTQRENLRNAIEDSPWLQDRMLSV